MHSQVYFLGYSTFAAKTKYKFKIFVHVCYLKPISPKQLDCKRPDAVKSFGII